MPVHTHDFAEVFWVDCGRGVHEAGGVRSEIGTGDLVCIRPADRHGFFEGDSDFTIVNVAFPASTHRHLKRRCFRADPTFFGGRGPRPMTCSVGPTERRTLAAASRELARLPGDLLALERFLLNLIHEVVGRPPRASLGACPRWLREACERLREPEHLAGGRQALAGLAGRSAEHVARQLRACAGRRPVDLVTEARIDHATTRLALSETPILDIALECGFDSLSHFYRVFRRKRGETPRAYRLRSQAAIR